MAASGGSLPLDTDIANTTPEELSALACQMNATPRKCLNYKTPREVFDEIVTKERANATPIMPSLRFE